MVSFEMKLYSYSLSLNSWSNKSKNCIWSFSFFSTNLCRIHICPEIPSPVPILLWGPPVQRLRFLPYPMRIVYLMLSQMSSQTTMPDGIARLRNYEIKRVQKSHSTFIPLSAAPREKRRGRKMPRKVRKKSWNESFKTLFPGGDKRDRTADLLNAIQALSQAIRYAPSDSFG